MKRLASTLAFALVVAGMGGSALAKDSMMNGSMMPKCAAGDPVVMVNPKTKMYMMPDKMHMKGMTMMCKSKADAMGAKMSKMKGHM